MAHVDVLVIGAGLIGLAVARELHQEGLQVAVYEQGRAGLESSWAGAGMLSAAQIELHSPLRALGLASARLYPEFVAGLRDETGLPIEYQPEGTLFIGERGEIPEEFEPVPMERLKDFEPRLETDGPVWKVPDGRVDSRQLLEALVAAVKARGIQLVEQRGVRKVEREGGELRVTTDNGSLLVPRVVNAAGAWAGTFEAPVEAPVKPRKGQILCLRIEPGSIRNVLVSQSGGKVYMVPRADGRLLIGATMEDVGFHRRVEPAMLEELRARAELLMPSLAEAPVAGNWAGLRPGTEDGLPLLGPTEVPGYWMATGHFRDGILLTPVTATIIARWMARGEAGAFDLARFRPNRDSGW